jgi:ribonuclease P protein component
MSVIRLFFSRSIRLTKKKEVDDVYASMLCRRTKFMMLHAKENGLAHSRIGISIPKRVGNAIIRNTLKRRLREAFRHVQHEVPEGYDLVVTIHKSENHKKNALETLILSVLQEYDHICKNK